MEVSPFASSPGFNQTNSRMNKAIFNKEKIKGYTPHVKHPSN